MVKFSIDKNKINQLVRDLGNFVASIDDWSSPLKKFSVILSDEQKKNFEQQGRIYGGWQPLAASTRKQRQRLGYGGARPILVRTGKLKNSFRTTDMGRRGFISKNVSDVAGYLQNGTSRGIPARKMVDISKKSNEALLLLLRKHISGNLNRFALGR